jgi:K+-sensing histidine kinase KdpD
MGLGLALCRMIIERHDGELSAAPAHPRGAVFRMVLPAGRRP